MLVTVISWWKKEYFFSAFLSAFYSAVAACCVRHPKCPQQESISLHFSQMIDDVLTSYLAKLKQFCHSQQHHAVILSSLCILNSLGCMVSFFCFYFGLKKSTITIKQLIVNYHKSSFDIYLDHIPSLSSQSLCRKPLKFVIIVATVWAPMVNSFELQFSVVLLRNLLVSAVWHGAQWVRVAITALAGVWSGIYMTLVRHI